MTAEDLTAFQASAETKRAGWTEKRRAYVAEAAKILPRMEPWPIRKSSAWKIKPPPGTVEDEAAD